MISLLADRMIAIMAGEPSSTSDYHQSNFNQISARQEIFSYHARRRRRRDIQKIESENEVRTLALCVPRSRRQ